MTLHSFAVLFPLPVFHLPAPALLFANVVQRALLYLVHYYAKSSINVRVNFCAWLLVN